MLYKSLNDQGRLAVGVVGVPDRRGCGLNSQTTGMRAVTGNVADTLRLGWGEDNGRGLTRLGPLP